jgi:hypothetical protein
LGAIQKESQRRLSIVRQRLRWRPASKRQDAASRHSSEKRYDQYYHDHAGPLTAKPFGRRRSLPPIWHQRVLYAATQKQRRSPRRLRVSERPSLPLAPACDDLTQFSDALVATKNALSVTTRSTMAGFVIG